MRPFYFVLLTCIAVVWSGAIGAQAQPQPKTFVINGHNGDAMVATWSGVHRRRSIGKHNKRFDGCSEWCDNPDTAGCTRGRSLVQR